MSVRRPLRILAWALAVAWLAATVYPLVWVAMTALKTRQQFSDSPLGLTLRPTIENFRGVFRAGTFGRFYLNGLVVTVVSVAATTAAAALAGYALARMRFRGSGALYAIFLLGLVVPVHATLLPLLRIESAIGLDDTLAGLILPYVAISLPVGVVIFRGFFRSLPVEVEEAARIDGAGRLRIIFQIAMPLARPAVATVVIFTSVMLWNEYVFALTLLASPGNFTLPLGLDRFGQDYATNVPLTCAAITMGLAPVVLVYLLAERHITRGLAEGAMR